MKQGYATKQAKSCVLHQNTKDSRSHHMPNLSPFLFPIFFSSPAAVENHNTFQISYPLNTRWKLPLSWHGSGIDFGCVRVSRFRASGLPLPPSEIPKQSWVQYPLCQTWRWCKPLQHLLLCTWVGNWGFPIVLPFYLVHVGNFHLQHIPISVLQARSVMSKWWFRRFMQMEKTVGSAECKLNF